MRKTLFLGMLILGSISLQGMEGGNPPAYEVPPHVVNVLQLINNASEPAYDVSPHLVNVLQQFQNASEQERAALCQQYSELRQSLFAVNPETGRFQLPGSACSPRRMRKSPSPHRC